MFFPIIFRLYSVLADKARFLCFCSVCSPNTRFAGGTKAKWCVWTEVGPDGKARSAREKGMFVILGQVGLKPTWFEMKTQSHDIRVRYPVSVSRAEVLPRKARKPV